jgi:WD40 repeat protein
VTHRIFLSSPTDVVPERDVVERVVNRINGDHSDAPAFALIRWEQRYYTAHDTFQEQIPRPSECELVVCIFWKRLGTDLPDTYRRSDGSIPTGTEYEFEDALDGASHSSAKLPDLLVYRKMADISFREASLELELAQRERFLAFWRRWFQSEKGQFVAGFQTFVDTDEFEREIDAHLRLWLKNRTGEVVWKQGSPYRGLDPYDVQHAAIFFGRKLEIERARARLIAGSLSGPRFLAILGPSGSGKSSLARAGLIPRLAIPGGMSSLADTLRWVIVTPSALTRAGPTKWAETLAEMLFADTVLGNELRAGDFNTSALLAGLLARGSPESAAPVERALTRAGQRTALVILIDQLEEIFTWDPQEATRFIGLLAALAGDGQKDAPVFVVCTMRSDFHHRLRELPQLAELVGLDHVRGPDEIEHALEVGLPSAADFREMIVGPALAAGLTLERVAGGGRDLQHLLESEARPGALPALQYLLSELYKRRAGDMLTLAAYDALGGVSGVMAARGTEVMEGLDPDARNAFPRLARALVTVGGANEAPSARAIGEETFKSDAAALRLVSALRDANLLTSEYGVLRIAHESLITGWPLLAQQIRTDRRLFEARESVGRACRLYHEPGVAPPTRKARLLEGFQLAEGRELLREWGNDALAAHDPALPDFIRASLARERFRRGRAWAIATGVTLAVALGGMGTWIFRQESQRAELQADTRLAIARSQAALREGDFDGAVAGGLAAVRLNDSAESRSALVTALVELSPFLERTLDRRAGTVAWSNASNVAAVADDGTLLALDTQTGITGVDLNAFAEAGGPPFALAMTADGGLVSLLPDGTLRYRPRGVQTWLSPSGATADPLSLSFPHQASLRLSDTELAVATADPATGVLVRRCGLKADFHCAVAYRSAEAATAVALSSSAASLAVAAGEGRRATLTLISLPQGETAAAGVATEVALSLPTENDQISALAWAEDDQTIALGSQSGGATTIPATAAAGNSAHWRAVSARPVQVITWSPKSGELALLCNRFEICIASRSEDGTPVIRARLRGHRDSINSIAWAPDGAHLASTSVDGTLRVWSRGPDQRALAPLFAVPDTRFTSVAVAPSGLIAAGAGDGSIWIYSGTSLRRLPGGSDAGNGPTASVAFAADGAVAAAGPDGVLMWTPTLEDPPRFLATNNPHRVAWVDGGRAVAVDAGREILVIPRDDKPFALPPVEDMLPGATVAGPRANQLIASYTGGSLRSWDIAARKSTILVDSATVGDRLSAYSLSLDPSGRWLAASRGDESIKVYDLTTAGTAPVQLDLFARDTKAVAFSPSGGLLAALGSDGRLYVWSFDSANGTALLRFSASATPEVAREMTADLRPAAWLSWLDDNRIAIATVDGGVFLLATKEDDWRARADQVRPLVGP